MGYRLGILKNSGIADYCLGCFRQIVGTVDIVHQLFNDSFVLLARCADPASYGRPLCARDLSLLGSPCFLAP